MPIPVLFAEETLVPHVHQFVRSTKISVAGTVNANYTTKLAFDLPGQCEEAKVIGDGDKDYGFLE